MDVMEVMGASDEQLFTTGTHTRNNASGGRQRILGWFGEDLVRFNNWTIHSCRSLRRLEQFQCQFHLHAGLRHMHIFSQRAVSIAK